MSEVNPNRVYPSLPKDGVPSGSPCLAFSLAFRLSTCTRAIEIIEENLRLDEKKRDSASKRHSRLRAANGISSAGSAALSASGAALSASGVGAVVGAPLVGVGALLGVASLATLTLDKAEVEKLTRYEKLISLGQAKLGSINALVSKALSDESISEEEFEKVNSERMDYDRQRTGIIVSRKKARGLSVLGRPRSQSQSLRSLTEELTGLLQKVVHRQAPNSRSARS